MAHGTLRFTLGGGDDLKNSRDTLNPGDIGFTVESDSVEEAERIYNKLAADGGKAAMPFAQAPWGDYFGMVVTASGWALTSRSAPPRRCGQVAGIWWECARGSR